MEFLPHIEQSGVTRPAEKQEMIEDPHSKWIKSVSENNTSSFFLILGPRL